MRASDVMTVEVITASADATVQDVARLLVAHRISAVPVVDGAGKLVGIISEGDLLRRAELGTERRRSWWLELISTSRPVARTAGGGPDEPGRRHGRRGHAHRRHRRSAREPAHQAGAGGA